MNPEALLYCTYEIKGEGEKERIAFNANNTKLTKAIHP
jgi:hypothetical protein